MIRTSRSASTFRTTRVAAALLAAALSCAPLATAAENGFPAGDQAAALLAQGVNNYRVGRFGSAAADFAAALKLDPENQLLYNWYLAAGDRLVLEMEARDELSDVLKDVLRRARIYQRELRRDPAYINLMISKLEQTEEERVVATNELVAVGPLAVPLLVHALTDTPQENRRAYCRVVLTKMGARSVIPLAETLNSADQRQVRSAAAILADIGDARALPRLVLLTEQAAKPDSGIEEATASVARNAVAAIARRNAIADVGTAEALHFAEAMRYFRDDAMVRDESVANEHLCWRWIPDAEGAAKLSYVRVPGYAWNELMAEEILFDGMAAVPASAQWHPLLAAVLAAQEMEAQRRLRLAKEATNPVTSPDEAADAIAERVKELGEAHLRLRMAGPAALMRGVQAALGAERYDVAAHLMVMLQDRDLAHADAMLPAKAEGVSPAKPGSVLVTALLHPQKLVRYQAAITLAHLDPALAFAGAEQVVPLLAEAVGEWGMRVVLLVEPDYRQRNAIRELLQSKGFLVYTAADGFEAVQRLAESPVKDAIVLAGDLMPWLRDEHGALHDVPEQRSATLIAKLRADNRYKDIPILVSQPEDPKQAEAVAKELEGKIGAGGLVAKPLNAVELGERIDLLLKDAQAPNANREDAEDVSLRAAIALQQPDPMRTQFALGGAAAALAGTAEKRADALRIEALKALGHGARGAGAAAGAAQASLILKVYSDQDASELEKNPQLRAAFLYAIGQIAPTDPAAVAILAKAVKHAEAVVRDAAFRAIGHGLGSTDSQAAEYQRGTRLDVRAPGAGAQ